MGRRLLFSLLFLTLFYQIISSIHATCLNDQRSKLLQFREGLNFDFIYANKLQNWNESTDCCRWDGIRCDSVGHVISLELPDQITSIQNENWKSLFNLEHLEYLNLAWSDFHDAFPVELRNLTGLKYLNFSQFGFFSTEESTTSWCDTLSFLSKLQVLSLSGVSRLGPICSSLLNLTSLTVLQLEGNEFSASVPDFFANFSSLISLGLGSNDFHGNFPEQIFHMPTLEIIDLSYNNELQGRLPEFQAFGSLKEIILSSTNFSGSVPNSIVNLRALSVLDLSACKFQGAIPSTLGNISELVYLDLRFNKFSGSIPSFQMSRKLVHIDLSLNALTGPIHSAHFEGLPDLQSITMEDNFLSGRLPSYFFALPSLQSLQISSNQFEGQIDQESLTINASSSLLMELDLSNNRLGGQIPNFFLHLQKIVVLKLSFNSFTGNLRADMFSGLRSLKTLSLSYNDFLMDATCNSTSTCLSSLPQLNDLELASCNLKIFPEFLKNQTLLTNLDLSLNKITGEIPNWFWNIRNGSFQNVNLSFNHLEGFQKPYNFSSISVLDLHANQLSGELPLPTPSMEYLDYSKNNFNVSIPPRIGEYLLGCVYLSLSNNNISGKISESICNVGSLKFLDLSDNSLSGGIPGCLFAMMENLIVLNLAGNNLQGLMPNTFSENCVLGTLDLSKNALKGKLPNTLSNCYLEVLNVGNNYLEDNFPCKLMENRPDLHILVLRSNRFHGEINCKWNNNESSWPSLQIVDIARNNFSGFLPAQLFLNWKGMMIEDIGAEASQPLQYEVSDFVIYLDYRHWSYQNVVNLTIKGVELELGRILTIYTVMDFSCNNFQGEIPDAIGELSALYLLNLSHNSFTGPVPASMGKLAQLGSLDLSVNQLTGKIPINLENLTFLEFLNLSYNQLVGKIPSGKQFQTFTESSFMGNRGLCGFPLNFSCTNDGLMNNNGSSSSTPVSLSTSKNHEIDWAYVSATLGFSVGLGIIFLLNRFGPGWWQRFDASFFHFILRILGLEVQERLYGNPL
ncbi:OLC1v1031897C1 [Oldenlandia corymbosa var. corymbosa]|uniref:OLC1v1031897C1 n=1 Tax=Oldenlandia corymbosa var. corymbosa TaxID=529605 RepID=A0AAV1CL74_OLDCO|nr:OLC1v1031897C1 [Oldenlandia corymbosa var. corymbosa]